MRLYAMPGTCALAPNIVAVWGGVPLDVVNLARGAHREPDYLAINAVPRSQYLVADKGYDSSTPMLWLSQRGTKPVIASKSNCKV